MHTFDRIYKEFQPKIERYLSHLVGAGEARDLTQSVFLKISQSLPSFRGESSLSTWIYRIATNTAHDYRASAQGQQKRSEEFCVDDASLDDLPDTSVAAIDKEYIRREMSACIRGVVEQLPENYRTVLILSDFDELSNNEIAAILNLSIETVKIRLHRGRAFLRKALDSQCSLYHDDRNELMCDRK